VYLVNELFFKKMVSRRYSWIRNERSDIEVAVIHLVGMD
jgi:hypothetical protein